MNKKNFSSFVKRLYGTKSISVLVKIPESNDSTKLKEEREIVAETYFSFPFKKEFCTPELLKHFDLKEVDSQTQSKFNKLTCFTAQSYAEYCQSEKFGFVRRVSFCIIPARPDSLHPVYGERYEVKSCVSGESTKDQTTLDLLLVGTPFYFKTGRKTVVYIYEPGSLRFVNTSR